MEQRIAIHQPYLFPYIGYFQLINAVDTFVIADDVQYMKKGWINRNKILMNGAPFLFTVPLHKASHHKLIYEIEIKQDTGWDSKLLKTIQTAYGNAPFFDEVFPLIERIVSENHRYLVDLISVSIMELANYLNINTHIVPSSTDYQTQHLQKEEIIIKICNQENCSHYINLIGGRNLYDKEDFKKQGITLRFLEPELTEYPQNSEKFVKRLSIIDVIMFNSPKKTGDMMKQFELV